MHNDQITRYTIELDALAPDPTAGEAAAIATLRSEFALALNAAYFDLLSADDIVLGAVTRELPQEGVARYTIVLELVERTPATTDEQAGELVRRAFASALNASHFIRTCPDDSQVRLVTREADPALVAGSVL